MNLSQEITITLFQLIITLVIAVSGTILLLYLITLIKGFRKNYVCKFAYIPKNILADVKFEANSRKMKIPNYIGSVVYHSHVKLNQMKKKFTYYKRS